jgi:hypothetical protein
VGTPRARRTEPYSPEEIAAAAAIAAALLDGSATPAAIAAILAPLLPAGIPSGSVDVPGLSRIVLRDPPEGPTPEGSGGGGLEDLARTENLLHRGFYGVAALRRLADGGSLAAEGKLFGMHQEANEARLKGARLNDAAAEKWGNLLGWHHAGTARTHRPGHEAADGKNFDVTRQPPASTGAWPAMLPFCDCTPRAPYPNGRLLN